LVDGRAKAQCAKRCHNPELKHGVNQEASAVLFYGFWFNNSVVEPPPKSQEMKNTTKRRIERAEVALSATKY
jgi:hypothetical protein